MTETLDGYNYKKCSKCHHQNSLFVNLILLSIITLILLSSFAGAYSATANVSTTSTIGMIRGDFYGVDDHYNFLAGNKTIDVNNDNSLEALSETTWHRNAFLNASLKSVRVVYAMDDYTNNSDGTITFSGNVVNLTNNIAWLSQNGVNVYLRLTDMPLGIAKRTGDCASNNRTCTALNYTLWVMDVLDIINRTTSGGLYNSSVSLEVWNEPYGSELLSSLPTDHINKSIAYVEIFNATYWGVKAVYPNMKVLGPSGYYPRTNVTKTFLSNLSSLVTDIDMHVYDTPNDFGALSKDVFSNCSFYNAPCSHIIWSEWNTGDSATKNTSANRPQSNSFYANAYSSALNSYPANLTLIYFSWSDSRHYGQYSYGYPQLWNMVTEPQLNLTTQDNWTYMASYNITKLFATNHKAGNTVLNSSSNDTQLKVVASKDATRTYITATNINSTSAIVSINIALDGKYLRDVETNSTYLIKDNKANFTISGYGVKTLDTRSYTTKANGGYTVYYDENGDEIARLVLETSDASCNTIIDQFGEFGTYFGIIGLAVVLIIFVSVLGISGNLDFNIMVTAITTLVVSAILVITGVILQNYLCQL